jgi:outer membrane biosynthesis protein TonB
MARPIVYPGDVPVDEPTVDLPKPKPAPKRKDKAVVYPKDAPVDEPVKKMAKGGVTRADGCAQRGKTKGRMV